MDQARLGLAVEAALVDAVRRLVLEGGLEAFGDEALANAVHRRRADVEGVDDLVLAPSRAELAGVDLEQDAIARELAGRGLAIRQLLLKRFAFIFRECHDIFQSHQAVSS